MTFAIEDLAGPVVVQVVAPWCTACKAMRPSFDAVAADFVGNVDVVTLDAAVDDHAAATLGVMGTPTIIGVRDGREVLRFTGRRTPAELREIFESVAGGDAPSTVGRQDAYLRLGAGGALVGIGLAVGPAWPLVAIGGGLLGVGAYSLRRGKPSDQEPAP